VSGGDAVSTSVPGLSEKRGIPWKRLSWHTFYVWWAYMKHALLAAPLYQLYGRLVWPKYYAFIVSVLVSYGYFCAQKTLTHGSYEICLCGILIQ
jgi:hypothetical protein